MLGLFSRLETIINQQCDYDYDYDYDNENTLLFKFNKYAV